MSQSERELEPQDHFYLAKLQEKYCKNGERDAGDVFRRVARGLAAAELPAARSEWKARFLAAMAAGFYPAGRIMSACGADIDATLINCFVQPVGDSIAAIDENGKPGIFLACLEAAETMRRGGGVGYDFSDLRPAGARVKGTQSRSSGPISYMRVFDRMCETVESAGARRGAQMGVLRVDHPDIEAFIGAKDIRGHAERLRKAGLVGDELYEVLQALRTLSNFNLSVAMTDAFVEAVIDDRDFELVHRAAPDRGEHPLAVQRADGLWVYKTVKARALFDRIMRTTYDTADPGVIFIDRMNADNNLAYCERIEATNPCVTADTWVHTAEGPRPVAQLIGKPFIARVDGAAHPSAAEGFFATGEKEILVLETEEGFRLRLTGDHPVLVVTTKTRWRRETAWRKAAELEAGDCIVLHDHRAHPVWPGPRTWEEGYLLGLLIGDGHLKEDTAILSVWRRQAVVGDDSPDGVQGIMFEALRCAKTLRHRADFKGWIPVAGRNELRLKLAAVRDLALQLGLAPDCKRFTGAMESGSSDFCRGALRGLFDADGSIQGSQEKGVSVRLTQVDVANLEAVQRTLLRLGIFSTIYRERKAAGLRMLPDGCGDHKPYPTQTLHELVIAGESLRRFADTVGFSDTAKAARLAALLGSYRRELNRSRFTARVRRLEAAGREPVFDVRIPGINAFDANGIYVHNCGEQPLPSYGCCCLGSLNLALFVEQPFGDKAAFNWERFREVVRTAVRMLDNVLDVTYWPLPAQRKEAQSKRRIGLGFTGLATAMTMLRLRYGGEASLRFAATVAEALRDTAYRASVDLAAERGAFPLFDAEQFLGSGFVARLPDDIRAAIRQHGIRNSHLLSIAPTGTISLTFGRNVSGGIEPAFAWEYQRTVKEKDGTRKSHPVQDWGYRAYLAGGGDAAQLPEWFVSAQELAATEHLAVQAAVQPFIDTSISKTINVPADYPFEDFRTLYIQAWQQGLKGCTTYRPNDVTGAVLAVLPAETPDPPAAPQPQLTVTGQLDTDRRLKLEQLPTPALSSLRWPGRPEILGGNPSWTYMVEDGAVRFAIFIGHIDNGAPLPFEVWVSGDEQPRGLGAIAKLLSMDMRSQDRGWLAHKLDTLVKTGGAPVTLRMPPQGQPVVWGSPTAALAALVRFRCNELGTFEHQGPTPVLDALMSIKEPKTGADGTMSWSVDVKNHNTGDDFVLTLKEVLLPDGTRRPISVWLAGDYPRDLDGLCKLLSLDCRIVDPAWIGEKLRKLLNYSEPMGDFLAQVPGSEKQKSWPSTVSYLAALILHRFLRLGILDENGQPVSRMGVMAEKSGPSAPTTALPQVAGKPCGHCGAHAVIRRDGCDFCTACGEIGYCG